MKNTTYQTITLALAATLIVGCFEGGLGTATETTVAVETAETAGVWPSGLTNPNDVVAGAVAASRVLLACDFVVPEVTVSETDAGEPTADEAVGSTEE